MKKLLCDIGLTIGLIYLYANYTFKNLKIFHVCTYQLPHFRMLWDYFVIGIQNNRY